MKKIMILAAIAAFAGAGCRVVKVEKEADGYRIYHNSHWLNTEADSIAGKMSPDGTLEFSLSGTKSSPSEEFVKSVKVYTETIQEIARLAAAAYNPASTGVSVKSGVSGNSGSSGSGNNSTMATSPTADCPDCGPTNCVDGVCGPATLKPTNR